MGDVLIVTVKIILTLVFLPAVIACVSVFKTHLTFYSNSFQDFLIYGMFAYLIVFLFVFKFSVMYEWGQSLIAGMLTFISPVNKLVSYLLPFYFPVILLLYFVVGKFVDLKEYEHYFLFFAGFTFAMHLLHSAQDLQEQEKSFVKPTYWLLMCFVVVTTLSFGILMFDLVTQEFTFSKFFQSTVSAASDNYQWALDKLLSASK